MGGLRARKHASLGRRPYYKLVQSGLLSSGGTYFGLQLLVLASCMLRRYLWLLLQRSEKGEAVQGLPQPDHNIATQIASL